MIHADGPARLSKGGPAPRLLAALAVALALTAPAQAGSVELSPVRARATAIGALQAGKPAIAAALADALIERDPTDRDAQVIKAQAAARLGDWKAARKAAAAVWRLTDDPKQRRLAALYAARAAEAAKQYRLARFWLRRVSDLTSDPKEEAAIARRFRQLKARDPLSYSFTFSVAPSSNVNGGTTADSFNWLGLEFTPTGASKALSGYRASLGGSLHYRLRGDRNSETVAGLDLRTDSYRLSDSARQQAPEARGSDYDFALAQVGLTHRFRRPDAPAIWSLGLQAGRTWYGHDPLSDFLAFDGNVDRPLSKDLVAGVGLNLQQQWRQDNARNDSLSYGGSVSLGRRLTNGDQVHLSLGLRQSDSASSTQDYRSATASLAWNRAKPLGPVGLDATLALEKRDYPSFALTTDGRHDLRANLSVDVVFERIEYMAFSPVMTLSAARTWSDFSFFDSSSYGVSFGLRSRF